MNISCITSNPPRAILFIVATAVLGILGKLKLGRLSELGSTNSIGMMAGGGALLLTDIPILRFVTKGKQIEEVTRTEEYTLFREGGDTDCVDYFITLSGSGERIDIFSLPKRMQVKLTAGQAVVYFASDQPTDCSLKLDYCVQQRVKTRPETRSDSFMITTLRTLQSEGYCILDPRKMDLE
jgi:hypothetical protein